ncbi:MAG: tetratricopeptide repeat protein [Chitinivibrionales bacterium]|nr:tetratricopeptide repeat protein [Chitinivibrionales bacterium]
MKRAAAIVILFISFGLWADQSMALEWLLEDVHSEEYIRLPVSSVTRPENVRRAMEHYHAGEYRKAARILESAFKLGLPDGDIDFIGFALAESYRQLGLENLARDKYLFLVEKTPESDKVAPSYFRLIQYAYEDRDLETAESILKIYEERFLRHPLYQPVVYSLAKLYYRKKEYGAAAGLLEKITQQSAYHSQSRFLMALCEIELKNPDKALLQLDYVRKNSTDEDLTAEASILIGDLYYLQDNPSTAQEYYRQVPKSASRYDYALVKIARTYYDLGTYDEARDYARDFIRKNPNSKYFFEMISLLEQAYLETGDTVKAHSINDLVYKKIVNARLSFEIYDELTSLAEAVADWKQIEFIGLRRKDKALEKTVRENIEKLENLKKEHLALLVKMGERSSDDKTGESFNLAVRQYLSILKEQIVDREDKLIDLRGKIEIDTIELKSSPGDTVLRNEIVLLKSRLDSTEKAMRQLEHEYAIVVEQARRADKRMSRRDHEGPAKYVDWSFIKYQKKKNHLSEVSAQMYATDTIPPSTDSLSDKGQKVARQFSEIDYERLQKELAGERDLLINHIKAMQEFYPNNKYSARILFRLAELYFDGASDDFGRRLAEYERKMEEGEDTAGLEFPDYDLSEVLRIYDKIIYEFPKDESADDAYFYKALALQKLGLYGEANDILVQLTEKYPESEYFVEANMNVGRYYFEHPKIENNKGYDLAEEAFRTVLQYRDHPQFIQALYNLGWCYYMQDHYEDAIAVFKYLIEEVELDFDPEKMDEKQVVNPLLRGEAIDYIAISFDEEKQIDDAVKFLELIGNIDYAALVLQRIGELRSEVQDYDVAIRVYRRLLEEYPHSIAAPDAGSALITIYDGTNRSEEALEERKRFFKNYARGSEWHTTVGERDSTAVMRVDSSAIAKGLYVADSYVRDAEREVSLKDYTSAAEYYDRVASAYPNHPRAVEGLWNLAVIYEDKLGKPKDAYTCYLHYSKRENANKARRHQAALNAIALAQKMQPPDSAVATGDLEPSTVVMLEAITNYLENFPDGNATSDVMISMAAVYFNRDMYSNAAKIYNDILKKGRGDKNYFRAMLLLGQCHFGEEKWQRASTAFKEVWRKSPDPEMKEKAYNLLLQSEFLAAKQYQSSGDHRKAAEAFIEIEGSFPGSQYSGVVLFNAAEAYEKLEEWDESGKAYFRLVDKYPQSELAPGALFNAASNYEKVDKFDKAAEAYEKLVDNYPDSDKAKDALFNVGFCYEKMGKLDKMAEVNERYTTLYPDEKDAGAMLIRSANFYYKTKMYAKAKQVYKNYVRRFGNTPQSVEALFMIGEIHMVTDDRKNAVMFYDQAEKQNLRFAEAGKETNNYFASEAAFATAEIKRKEFAEVKFDATGEKLKKLQEQKSSLLAQASKSYTRVIKYKSKRMFEAAYQIGQMYENFGRDWFGQKREKLDPIKTAVFEKDLYLVTSGLIERSFKPYEKLIEIGQGFDSLSQEDKKWIENAKTKICKNHIRTGDMIVNSVGAMYKAPIPDEIKKKPLHYFQYLKQLNETLKPIKIKARDYFLNAYHHLNELEICPQSAQRCLERFGQLNYMIGSEYEKLAQKIVKEEYETPGGLDEVEREELLFQLEDIVFELQDNAIFAYEDAMNWAQSNTADSGPWYSKIMEGLARLSPDMYGADFYETRVIPSNRSWVVRTDEAGSWYGDSPPLEGWKAAAVQKEYSVPPFPSGNPEAIWSPDSQAKRVFIRKDIFLDGKPRDAVCYFSVAGKYKLYLNGQVAIQDTLGEKTDSQIDSLGNISRLLRGGDNVAALEVEWTQDRRPGVALCLKTMLDTTTKFTSSAPRINVASMGIKPDSSADGALGSIDSALSEPPESTPDSTAVVKKGISENWYVQEYKSRGELLNAIEDYQKRSQDTQQAIRKERLELRKLQVKEEFLDAKIETMKKEIEELNRSISEMKRGK